MKSLLVSNQFNIFWHVNGEDSAPVITVVGYQVMISNGFDGEDICNLIQTENWSNIPFWFVEVLTPGITVNSDGVCNSMHASEVICIVKLIKVLWLSNRT